MARDPKTARNEYGRAITQGAASWRITRRAANSAAEDAADCREDLDRIDLGSSRAAQAMRVENYGR